MAELRLLKPAVLCPRCEAPPAIRVPEAIAARYRDDHPAMPVESHICRKCSTQYWIRAVAYQKAVA